MKMTEDHYLQLQAAIEKTIAARPDIKLEDYLKRGNTAMRWRWDLMHFAGRLGFHDGFLWKHYNDSHVDTALRKITNTH